MSEDLYEERRRLKRRHLIYYLKVTHQADNHLIGYLVDITTEGLMLISNDPIEPQTEFPFRMALPEEVLSKNEIEIQARCMWCKKDVNPDFYASGFQIMSISEEDQIIITSLIRRHGFQD